MRINELPKSSRPRERFLSFGPGSLSDAELLALILRTGTRNENVIELSNRLIAKFTLGRLFDSTIVELKKMKGIGESKAMQILTIAELAKRCNQVKKLKTKISSAKDVFNLLNDEVRGETKESFYVILLNTKNKILKVEKVSVGILDATIIHPREIFKPAIRNSAARIILAHNHPSGDPLPSDEDLSITRKLIESGELIGIEVIDHVIIGDKNYWSYSENN